MPRLAIFGTGGMGREIFDILSRSSAGRHQTRKIVFVANNPQGPVLETEVIPPDELTEEDEISLGVGSSAERQKLSRRFAGRHFFSVVSQTSLVSPSASFGAGAQICDHVVINNQVQIGEHFQCNTFSHVAHDCVIGDFVTFAPRVTCNGWVEVGSGAFIGAGAIIRNGSPQRRLTIGEGATVGMGAVVTKNVSAGATVVGNPAVHLQRQF
jgi:sugar O-acyltransferase (sialic acid O-acetyltransferase NeuD family)